MKTFVSRVYWIIDETVTRAANASSWKCSIICISAIFSWYPPFLLIDQYISYLYNSVMKNHEMTQHFTDMRQSDVSEICSCMCSFMCTPIFVLLQLKAPFPVFLTITPYLKSNPPALKRRECTMEWKAALCTISPLASIWQLELSVNTSLNYILVPLLCLKAHFWEDLHFITHTC